MQISLNNFDVLVVGCGFSGAVTARCLAEKGKKVLILEKRNHIAGNMYDCPDENGILVHRYGPHIFHTSNLQVYKYLCRFSQFFPYGHRVLGKIDGKFVPIPFNFKSAELLFGDAAAKKLKDNLTSAFPGRTRITVPELLENRDESIKEAGRFIFEKVFLHYTAKQWAMPPEKVDRSVLSRVPVVLGYDDRYFSDPVQCMPSDGYTKLFENMLDHKNITVKLGFDAMQHLKADCDADKLTFDGEPVNIPVVWTGPADELFGCVYGRLPYRSLDLHFENYSKTQYQPASVVNYPNDELFTRITEFKYLTGQQIEGTTTIMKEYPSAYNPEAKTGNIPYYPVLNPENLAVYQKYSSLAQKFNNLYLCGRLAGYKYYNMDGAVANALALSEKI